MVVRGSVAAGLLMALIITALLSAAPHASAQEYSWCGVYRTGSERCSFVTEAQCTASLGGEGGFCRMLPNAAAAYASAPSRGRR
jgi:hypothetical protein